ncbi:hypothetical protein AMATHDRAFT_45503 [Amanita thiersii Skay4041]|uniref:Aip3p/Bud6 N-terminal domain-containing protein n=1 Tax=Amanita thiersii Skay4041 TaxID=703135 RepID=A0A2A9NYV3_9AGAR|nr:hypothetical protein AMATHDRAFT_45503 [Amanita thiersii Skay4041]
MLLWLLQFPFYHLLFHICVLETYIEIMSAQQQRIQGDVPTAVHNLLSSTSQLQDLLRQWSIGHASETQVSDLYVKIGTDFNTTLNAFMYHNIELTIKNALTVHQNSDIYTFPKELRAVLEQCLGEAASPATLERYMPQVRQILYKLLRGLQMRQDAWRTRVGASSSAIPSPPPPAPYASGGRPLPSYPAAPSYDMRR